MVKNHDTGIMVFLVKFLKGVHFTSVSPEHCRFDGRSERQIFCGLLRRANNPQPTGLDAESPPLKFSIWVSICAGACFELKIVVFQSDPIFGQFL